jgi:CPA2 family monovalent cation:H+ antiporter-2
MLLDVGLLPSIIHWVALLVLGIVVLKALLIMGLSVLFGYEQGIALRTGIVLAQGGEFGFAVLALALKDELLSTYAAQIILASVVISMALSPALIRYNGWFAKRFFAASYGGGRQRIRREIEQTSHGLEGHVLILGYGRVGQSVARFVEKAGVNYMALDVDPVLVREARAAGQNVHYGDSSHLDILEAAGLSRARVLVISFDSADATAKILEQVRTVGSDIPILVRTRDDENLERFQESGATEVVPETLEASLMLVSHLLLLLDVPASKIFGYVQDVRADRYGMMRQFFHGQEAVAITQPQPTRGRLSAVKLTAGAFAVGRTLRDLDLGAIEVTVTAINRPGQNGPKPKADTALQAEDVLVLYGTPEALDRAKSILLSGK